MIDPKQFYEALIENGIDFFTGVPDSTLKDICAYITDNTKKERNIIAANEGGAVALATGYHLATNDIPLVYMQNSGIGNTVNPLMSLTDPYVYSIPMLLMIGWRGEPGKKDEPQHKKQGKVTLQLLEAMGIKYQILPDSIEGTQKIIQSSVTYMRNNNAPFAIVIRKGTFENYKLKTIFETDFELTREQAIKEIVQVLSDDDIVVSTTGKTSRELFELRDQLGQNHEKDFLTVGSMGHASQIALGIAIKKTDRNVFCFDGDGAALMHAGSMGIIGNLAPKNFKHIIINNGAHDSVGGQPTIGLSISFEQLARTFNYRNVFSANSSQILKHVFKDFAKSSGPNLLEIFVKKGSRKDLGRPTTSPLQNKQSFKKNLH